MTPVVIEKGDHRVTIYELKNKAFTSYCICFKHNGERCRRTRSNYEEAKREAERILNDLALGDGALSKLSLKELQYYQQCEASLAGVPLHVAVQAYLRTHSTSNVVASPPIRTVIHELLDFAKRDKSERHVKTLKHHLTPLADDAPIDKITVKMLEQALSNPEWSKRTRQNHLVSFSILFNFAQRKGYLPDGKTEADKLERTPLEPKTPEIFTPDEMCKLLDSVCPEGIPFLVLGAFAGIRAQEIQRLTWDDIDLSNKIVKLNRDKTKTKRRRVVPLSDNLIEWLVIARQHFLWEDLDNPSPASSPQKSYTAPAAEASGVRWKQNGLRHSFVSYHLALEQNAAKTALISGHTQEEAEESYLELVTQEEAKRWFSIFPSCKDGKITAYYRSE